MKLAAFLVPLALLSLIAAGCGPSSPTAGALAIPVYNGPERPESEIATLRPIPPMYTISVDGKAAISARGNNYVDGTQIRMLEGRHTVVATYYEPIGHMKSDRISVIFVALAGHHYKLSADVQSSGKWYNKHYSCRPAITDITTQQQVPLFNPDGPTAASQ